MASLIRFMMKQQANIFFILSALLLVLYSCKKEEALRDAPEIITTFSEEPVYQAVAKMGSDYQDQVYFSLETAASIDTHLKTDWDLSLSTENDAWQIRLNSSRLMKLWKSPYTAIYEIINTEEIEADDWLYDTPDGTLQGNAFGDWRNSNEIYVIDMGVSNIDGSSYGFYKCKLISVGETNYTIDLAEIAATSWTRVEIPKLKTQAEVLFSITNREVISRPDAGQYELFFTQYTHIFDEEDGPLPYLVTGALIDNGVEVALVNDKDYDDINSNDIANYTFENRLDMIGYDWKNYDLDLGVFTIFPEKNYLVKNRFGNVYKLHFIDFYNDQGIKGFPKLEFQKIIAAGK